MPDRRDTIAPRNFFSFLIAPAGITDADLKNSTFAARNLGNNFRLYAETVLAQSEGSQNLGTKDFVTALHIRQVQTGE